ncbi:uncharacterized protein LOC118600344 [Rousettus aegyptiacus]|uniref:uncharacterized protein LOC118600344 n=1 Tax=Rousettus aegyptiacus TaxID=9407 RepID=UPI00168D353F|nr:uncharacterized protein LOC118600344 [Rousettus aegyptiacus]
MLLFYSVALPIQPQILRPSVKQFFSEYKKDPDCLLSVPETTHEDSLAQGSSCVTSSPNHLKTCSTSYPGSYPSTSPGCTAVPSLVAAQDWVPEAGPSSRKIPWHENTYAPVPLNPSHGPIHWGPDRCGSRTIFAVIRSGLSGNKTLHHCKNPPEPRPLCAECGTRCRIALGRLLLVSLFFLCGLGPERRQTALGADHTGNNAELYHPF